VTTTLRPAAPEERGPHAARSRDFTVCVNGRPVGGVRLATDGRLGPAAGRVTALAIDPPDRRRGRATVAALAAEEVLRSWGCREVRASVPADVPAALRLAAALGYVERNRTMVKPLVGPVPPLPSGSVLRPMDAADHAAWSARARADYVDRWVAEGASAERAAEIAEADHAAVLPDGARTAGTALRVLAHEGVDVGWLWVRTAVPAADPTALPWTFLVETAAGSRGRGHGRTLMLAAEAECLAVGADRLGLNVFADNVPASRLYASLGYRPTSYEMVKPLL
jgi:GNAT superfamily N-acetyltransferase